MKSRSQALLLAIGLIGLANPSSAISAPPPPVADFYVSPDGRDSNPGTFEKPFATLTRARDALRTKIAAGLEADVRVLLRGGVYRLTEPVTFGVADSGTSEHAVFYTAFPGEKPILSGGRTIAGWRTTDGGVWKATIPAVRSGDWAFRELFVQGERRPRARHPNDGYLRVEKAGPDDRTSFTYRPGDLHRYEDLTRIELVFLHDWSISRIRLRDIDEATRTVSLADPVGPSARHYAMSWFEKQPRYVLENSAAFLDQPGEWLLDTETGELTYVPLPGEKPGDVEIVAPLATRLLVVSGDWQSGTPIRNLHFAGLHFEHCAWPIPVRGYAAGQAGYHELRVEGDGGTLRKILPAALVFELAEGCSLEDGRIAHVGMSAIAFGSRCRGNRLVGNVIDDVSGNGVLIGEDRNRKVSGRDWWRAVPEQVARNNRVENNLIQRCGRQFFGSVAVWVGLAEGTRIAHNVIRHHPYTGVSLGWMWNPTPTPCKGNVVERNHIHHCMQVLSDGGGIYTLGLQPGSALRENLIHDIPLNAGRAESNGMFLDEGTTDFVVERNVIYNIQRSPLRFHKATTNLVRQNVLVVGENVPPIRYNNTQEANIDKVDNTVVEKTPPAEALAEIRGRAGLEKKYLGLLRE